MAHLIAYSGDLSARVPANSEFSQNSVVKVLRVCYNMREHFSGGMCVFRAAGIPLGAYMDNVLYTRTVCRQCPRCCGVPRTATDFGFCGMPAELYVSRMAPHQWEEPPISGTRGSGAVFFTGCSLRCVFCQNRDISRTQKGTQLTEEDFARRLLVLADSGVHNINLVTPTHYTETIARVLGKIKPKLKVPVVWNSGGYELPEKLRLLDGLVDIYLPDFKYASHTLAGVLSGALDYPDVAADAITEMYRQVGKIKFTEDGSLLQRGLLVRHLVLPGCRRDSFSVLGKLAGLLPTDDILVSVMSQYTPDFLDPAFRISEQVRTELESQGIRPALHRRLTDFEYRSVLDEADRLGIKGYRQGRASAQTDYTPDFGDGKLQ